AETQSETGISKLKVQNIKSKDLDLIVLKSLKKASNERYASVAEFAADIERFLNGFPVKAAPDSFFYRNRKFLKRHKSLVSVALAASVLIFLAAPFAYLALHNSADGYARKDQARRLTFSETAENYPHFAPDNRIVFTRSAEDVERLFSINLDGSNERLLSDAADRAVFSLDGKRVAFRSTKDYRIYTANADFSQPRKTTHGRAGRPAWSPDSQKIIFSYDFSEDLEKSTQPMYQDRDNVEIFSVNADGSGETNLTNNPAFDSDACASPDGSQIAFASDRDGAFEIYVMNADGLNVRRLTRNEFEDVKPSWSPDGRRIAFTSRRDGDEEIYVMNADGSNPQRVTNALGDDREPQWSPDGKQIVFSATGDGNAEIYIIDVPAE
ncbi:MAG: hypothetical protein ACR2HG_00475, partial [Pyrinomonadaceae bacterium]